MGMGLGTVAIITAARTQIDFQHLIHFLEQSEGLIDRGVTYGWELPFYLFIELVCTGMPFTDGNHSDQLDPLGGQAEIAFFQRGDQLMETNFWIGQGIPSRIDPNR